MKTAFSTGPSDPSAVATTVFGGAGNPDFRSGRCAGCDRAFAGLWNAAGIGWIKKYLREYRSRAGLDGKSHTTTACWRLFSTILTDRRVRPYPKVSYFRVYSEILTFASV